MGRRKSKKRNKWQVLVSLIVIILIAIFEYATQNIEETNVHNGNVIKNENIVFDLSTIPEYTSSAYVEINNNIPYFTEDDFSKGEFEEYSKWDNLGRSGVAFANISIKTIPKEGEEREDIGSVKNLSGWVQKRYDNLIKDKYLYNRCHLIGWQLGAENANKENLITGTRYLNTEGMLPFENIVAGYIKTNLSNHVLYRVTPIYEGDNKLASGVLMEAWSVEDKGQAVCFNVYCYNVQPGVVIDYATGESYAK